MKKLKKLVYKIAGRYWCVVAVLRAISVAYWCGYDSTKRVLNSLYRTDLALIHWRDCSYKAGELETYAFADQKERACHELYSEECNS